MKRFDFEVEIPTWFLAVIAAAIVAGVASWTLHAHSAPPTHLVGVR
jgi:hypothetical protein